MNNTEYNAGDASLEILIMLFVAFLLGYFLRLVYEKYFTECVDDEQDQSYQDNFITEEKKDTSLSEEQNDNEIIMRNVKQVTDDDLKQIEGIGPKIEGILKDSGLDTFEKISNTEPESIRKILLEIGGERYAFHDPTTWPDQAKLIFEGKTEELMEYQNFLRGGKI